MTSANNVIVTTTDPGYDPGNASASVIVTPGLGPTNVSTGLTNNLLTDSFFLPLVIAVIGIWMYRSGFLGIMPKLGIKNPKDLMAQRTLQNKILQIRQKENAI